MVISFENPTRIDAIRKALDAGEIVRGDKGDTRVTSPEGIDITFYPKHNTIHFTQDGYYITANLDEYQRASGLHITVYSTGETVYDVPQHLIDDMRVQITNWAEAGLFQTDT